MKIICISDTHNKHEQLTIPMGDVIVHAGDFSEAGTRSETNNFMEWFSNLPHPNKILIAGNHDFYLESNQSNLHSIIPQNITYLQDSGTTIENINFWGSPYSPGMGNWAFVKNRGVEISKHWKLIPENTHYLITHSPPYGVMDELNNKRHVGCEELIQRINEIKLPNHIFGHIHNDYGIVKKQHTTFINSASLDESYRHINKPIMLKHNFLTSS